MERFQRQAPLCPKHLPWIKVPEILLLELPLCGKWFVWFSAVIFDSSAKPRSWLQIAQDKTGRKEWVELLRGRGLQGKESQRPAAVHEVACPLKNWLFTGSRGEPFASSSPGHLSPVKLHKEKAHSHWYSEYCLHIGFTSQTHTRQISNLRAQIPEQKDVI